MQKKILNYINDFLFYVLGCFIYSSAVTMFVSANEISPGGITGIATALGYLLNIPSGPLVFILNLPILIVGFIKLGGLFIFKTTIATTTLSVALTISEKVLMKFEVDKILASVFGGVLMGFGLSLVMLRGATTGGVDIIAKLINKKYRHITMGKIILVSDIAVIAFAAIAYKNVESALYSIIAIYASSRVMDIVLYGADKGKIVYIITVFPDRICEEVGKRLHRGITRLNATGGYTGEKRELLICTLRRHEVSELYSIINEYDKRAFTVVSEAGEIMGEGFKNIE